MHVITNCYVIVQQKENILRSFTLETLPFGSRFRLSVISTANPFNANLFAVQICQQLYDLNA